MIRAVASAALISLLIPTPGAAEQRSFTFEYVAPTNPSLQQIATTLKSARVLEAFAATSDRYFDLPKPVRISLNQCNAVNAFYESDPRQITLCYELLLDLAKRLDGQPRSDELFFGTLVFVTSHELGHALINVLDLPVLGREEDAADELAALALIEDPEGAPAVAGTVEWFSSNAGGRVSLPEMADEHALSEQRYFNMLCWAYGANPKENQDLVANGLLPEARAQRCPTEYAQIRRSWYQLLGNHLKRRLDAPEEATAPGTAVPPLPTVAETLGTDVAKQPEVPGTEVTKQSAPAVEMSRSGICYEAGTGRYDRIQNFEPFNSLEDCLNSGGRLPR